MENNKRFYWIKLKTNFFSREDIDFLLSQKNGAEYVVLYQMLCLNTANNDGRLESKIGEILVPYNADKIVRDCKYFDIDTVNIAMALYKKLGLIYEEEDMVLKISNYDEMVGSETAWAEKKRVYRQNKKALENRDNLEDISLDNVKDNVKDNVRQEYRDKSIEYRGKNIDIYREEKSQENEDTKTLDTKKFIKPTVEEIREYCNERKNNIDAEYFYDFYESKGWYVGKNKMKNWKACVRTWEKDAKNNQSSKKTKRYL